MALSIKPWNPNTHNADIINALRGEASSDFQRRIPAATKADFRETLQHLDTYTPSMNEFTNALVNKIGRQIVRNNSWTNPLAIYKIGMLEFGDTIEEVQAGLIKAYTFDPRRSYGEAALFGKHSLDVQTSYHTINRENFYPITVQRSTLRRAFLSETGLSDFISGVLEAPMTSDAWDEFLLMTELFAEYEKNGGFFKVHVDDIGSSSATDAESRRTLRTLREYAETIPFLSTAYNAAGMPVHAKPEDLILITTPQFKSGIDVQGLAAMFNVSYAEVPFKTHVVPRERIGIPGVEAILTTKDFFVVADTYLETSTQPNPAGRYENYFLHHDQIISASRFVPAIAFTTGAGTVIELTPDTVTSVTALTITDSDGETVTANEVERGKSYDVSATIEGEGNADGIDFDVVGFESPHSYIANTGTFHVAINETAEEVTLTATSTQDDSKSVSRVLAVTGDVVSFWPAEVVADEGE